MVPAAASRLLVRTTMRDSIPNSIAFDPEEFATSPFLEATDEHEAVDLASIDVHERPTLVP